jgi:hypothetical protein
MSKTEQETLAAVLNDSEPEDLPTSQCRPDPDADDQRECQGCGGHVTPNFARVFGDNYDVVHSCPRCATAASRVRENSGARPDWERENDFHHLHGGYK